MKILFVSLGCDKNLADTESMLGLLASRGYEMTDDEAEADVMPLTGSWTRWMRPLPASAA